MGNEIHKHPIYNAISLQVVEVEINSFNTLFYQTSIILRKIEEIRWFISYKLNELAIKTGIIVIENPTIKDMIKSILWKLAISVDKLENSYKVLKDSPYVEVNLTNRAISDKNKNDLIEVEEKIVFFFDYYNNNISTLLDLEERLVDYHTNINKKLNNKTEFVNYDKHIQ